MLRWSAQETNVVVDVAAIVSPGTDPRIEGGIELLRFTDAVLGGRSGEIALSGDAVTERLGPDARTGAAGVIATFQMMNRVADATGMPVAPGSRARNADLIESLGLERFDHHGGAR